ncbi:hypothetical protein N7488_006373 [Penicillium malachiteum]|nr:hypothetical protein N7488_006373 [Penicillium malachiteum]
MAQKALPNCALPMTPPLVVPAMEIHLLNYRAGSSLSRRLALNKLQACMMVLEDFQIMYTVASIYRGIFAQAIHHVCPEEDQTTSTSICNSATAVNTSQNDATLLSACYCPRDLETDISHAVDALLDDSAISSFWDGLGHFQMG